MNKLFPVGEEFFDALRIKNRYFVDKTEMIYNLVAETANNVTLFTRPRRFGKTLTMSMLDCFFSNQREADYVRSIFADLNIAKNHPEFCDQWMGQYPTLFISLKDVDGEDFDLAFKKLKNMIANLCKKYRFLQKSDLIDDDDKEIFARLKAKTSDKEEVQNALQSLTRMLHEYTGKNVILLIDEYDVPLQKAQSNGYYDQMLEMIRGLMSSALKTNEYLQFAVLTGCLQISKESIFTGVNNFKAYSVLDNAFSDAFGFTHQDVSRILNDYGWTDKAETIERWYDGYLFGNTKIYCPWDLVNYFGDLQKDPNAPAVSYWENTSSNDVIDRFFEMKNDELNTELEMLLNGERIRQTVTKTLTYGEVYSDITKLWSILLMTGYVTPADTQSWETNHFETSVNLRIPNLEIKKAFMEKVVTNFRKTVDQTRIQDLMLALWQQNVDEASKILSELLFNTISYLNYQEDFYQGFMAGLFTGRGYNPRTEREHGVGRSDVTLADRVNRRSLIIETKVSHSEEMMDATCDEAIGQIRDRRYHEDYEFRSCDQLICYGLAFYKKTVKIKLM